MLGFLPFFLLTNFTLAAALALSLFLVLRQAVALTRGTQTTAAWTAPVVLLVAVTMLSVLTIDGLRLAALRDLAAVTPLVAAVLLLIAMPLAWIQFRSAAQRRTAAEHRRSPLAWGALWGALATSTWASYRLQSELQPPAWDAPVLTARPVSMERETQLVGLSDRGREIPLFRSTASRIAPQNAIHLERQAEQPGGKHTVILRAAPDDSSNCHGWVFTDGQFLLDAEGLKIILADNGYAPCDAPQAGDVVVYFERGDAPVHTGIVSGVLRDGTVIVESKWGTDGRYLHRPADQPYSSSFVFYRSQRGGNQITIRDTSSALAKQRLPAPRRVRKA